MFRRKVEQRPGDRGEPSSDAEGHEPVLVSDGVRHLAVDNARKLLRHRHRRLEQLPRAVAETAFGREHRDGGLVQRPRRMEHLLSLGAVRDAHSELIVHDRIAARTRASVSLCDQVPEFLAARHDQRNAEHPPRRVLHGSGVRDRRNGARFVDGDVHLGGGGSPCDSALKVPAEGVVAATNPGDRRRRDGALAIEERDQMRPRVGGAVRGEHLLDARLGVLSRRRWKRAEVLDPGHRREVIGRAAEPQVKRVEVARQVIGLCGEQLERGPPHQRAPRAERDQGGNRERHCRGGGYEGEQLPADRPIANPQLQDALRTRIPAWVFAPGCGWKCRSLSAGNVSECPIISTAPGSRTPASRATALARRAASK